MQLDLEPPILPVGLVEHLRQSFPDVLPRSVDDAERGNIARLIGQQQVIDHIEALIQAKLERHQNVPT